MKNCALVLNGFQRFNRRVEHVQRRLRRSTKPAISSKGTTVFTLLAILGIASVAGIAGSIVVSTRDGYRRQPKQPFARTV